MSELKGMLFDVRRTIYPEDTTHKEVLRHISQVVANKALEPARQELESRILEAVNAFMDRKLNLPDADKEAFRYVPPFDVILSFRGDSLLDFLGKVDLEIQFIYSRSTRKRKSARITKKRRINGRSGRRERKRRRLEVPKIDRAAERERPEPSEG